MANTIYNSGIPYWSLFADSATPSGLVLKVALLKSSYTADKDHETMADINTHEVEDTIGASYTRATITGQDESVDDTNDWVKYDADNVTFSLLTTDDPVKWIVVYADLNTGTPSDSDTALLVAYDLGASPRQPNGTDFVIAWSSNGLVTAQQG